MDINMEELFAEYHDILVQRIDLFNVIDPDTKERVMLSIDGYGYWYIAEKRLISNYIVIGDYVLERAVIYAFCFIDRFKGMTLTEFNENYYVYVGNDSPDASMRDNIRIYKMKDGNLESLVYENMSCDNKQYKTMYMMPADNPYGFPVEVLNSIKGELK